jgi:predicted alpha/beta hydrolase family esterase
MKRAIILHGTDGKPDSNWFMWLKAQLESHGYEVWVPLLPNNHTPNRIVYNDFLFNSDWDFTDNIVIGHSSGAVSVLNLLMDGRCPHIQAACMIGVWARMEGTELAIEQFKNLFPLNGFDFPKIKNRAGHFLYIHGSDDPYCPIDQAKWIAENTGGDFVTVPNGQHLGANSTELPELLTLLQKRELL